MGWIRPVRGRNKAGLLVGLVVGLVACLSNFDRSWRAVNSSFFGHNWLRRSFPAYTPKHLYDSSTSACAVCNTFN